MSEKVNRVIKWSLFIVSLCAPLIAKTDISKSEETMLNFLQPSDSSLRNCASKVPVEQIKSVQIQSTIDQMLKIARGEREDIDSQVMVGLAAPQVGIPLRIILVDMGVSSDRKDLGQLKVFINPEIVWYSDEKVEGREGCYSVDVRMSGIVSRSQRIKIRAFDREGNPVEDELSDFTARIFQHEVDHLEGMCFPDRVGRKGNLHWVEEDEYPEYRKNWQTWPHPCSWDTWMDMKEGRPYSSPRQESVSIKS